MSNEYEIAEYAGGPDSLHALWREVAAERPWETRMDSDQFSRKFLEDPFSKQGFILSISARGKPVAAAYISLSKEMERAWLRLWVLPAFRGKGHGTRLVEGSIARLRGRGKWRLECEIVPFCRGYVAFFKARGFRPDADFPGGYLMRREMTTPPAIEGPQGCRVIRLDGEAASGYLERIASVGIGHGEGAVEAVGVEERVKELTASMADAVTGCYSLALDGERVIGYSRSALVENVAGEIQLRNRGLIVSPDCRGRGLGRALLDDNLAWGCGKGARAAFISTHSGNPAKRLYERAGYEVVETLENLALSI